MSANIQTKKKRTFFCHQFPNCHFLLQSRHLGSINEHGGFYVLPLLVLNLRAFWGTCTKKTVASIHSIFFFLLSLKSRDWTEIKSLHLIPKFSCILFMLIVFCSETSRTQTFLLNRIFFDEKFMLCEFFVLKSFESF